jgi:phospholipase C
MSVGRQWVRRLGLLLAAGMVVQVPGLVGVGVSGASAANASYTATLSQIGSNCVASVTATWSNTKPQSVQFQVNDLTTDASTNPQTLSVSGNSRSLSYSVQLKSLPAGTVTRHSFNAIVNFYGGNSSPPPQKFTNSQDAPCYLGQLPL